MSETYTNTMEKRNAAVNQPIICVTNRKLCQIPFIEQVEKIARSGISRIILREKDLSEKEYGKLAVEFLNICRLYHVEGILHTYGDIALSTGAESLHLSMEDLRFWQRQHRQGMLKRLGVSVHSAAEAREAERLGADYITAGHIYSTDCKKGIPGRGADFLRDVVKAVNIPVYAIGGISILNIKEVRSCGSAGACVMSSLMKTQSPSLLAAALQEAWDNKIF